MNILFSGSGFDKLDVVVRVKHPDGSTSYASFDNNGKLYWDAKGEINTGTEREAKNLLRKLEGMKKIADIHEATDVLVKLRRDDSYSIRDALKQLGYEVFR